MPLMLPSDLLQKYINLPIFETILDKTTKEEADNTKEDAMEL